MNDHLSSEQMAALLISPPDAALDRHVRACPRCEAELVRLQGVMAQFRNTVVAWSDREDVNGPRGLRLRMAPHSRSVALRWALTAAVAVIVLFLPVYKITVDRRLESQVIEDRILLNDIESRLSRRVPSALAPAMELMAEEWHGDADSGK